MVYAALLSGAWCPLVAFGNAGVLFVLGCGVFFWAGLGVFGVSQCAQPLCHVESF